MPFYKGTIFKQRVTGGPVWSNVYTLNTTSLEDALANLATCRINEQNVSYSGVHFLYGIVREAIPGGLSMQQTYDTNGELDPTGLGGPLPLFCTVRVSFSDGYRKPEQKYLRLLANEANLTLGVWDAELTAYVMDNYVTPMLGIAAYVGPSGEHPTSGLVHTEVQNRQLGWHRRTRPGYRRGWVPV